MSRFSIIFVASALCLCHGKSVPNNTAVLISKYAKVAVWGQNQTEPKNEGRSQHAWLPRSDVNVVGGQALKKKTPVVYQFPQSRKAPVTEIVPGIGEVIQERFNPKPYFKYGQIPPGGDDHSIPDAPSPTFNSFPVFQPSKDVDAKPSTNGLYASPYTSYNPPQVAPRPDVQVPGPAAPPAPGPMISPPMAKPSETPKDSYAAPPMDAQTGGVYDYKPEPSKPPQPIIPAEDNDVSGPPEDDHHHDAHGPPKEPPKSIDDVYYPPDDHPETIVDYPPSKAPMGGPGGDPKPDMAEDELSPPPTDQQDEPRFPSYLYSGGHPYDFDHDHDHHHDHHLYEEVPHPTTTPKAEDERVNKAHYSYYYLGRKLWYIPLYFSVYFVIYVTVLILKSIARHKIQFKHHFDDKRKARELTLEERVDEAHRNVTNAIEKARIKYMAM